MGQSSGVLLEKVSFDRGFTGYTLSIAYRVLFYIPNTRTYVHTYTRTHVHTYTRTHVHTYTRTYGECKEIMRSDNIQYNLQQRTP